MVLKSEEVYLDIFDVTERRYRHVVNSDGTRRVFLNAIQASEYLRDMAIHVGNAPWRMMHVDNNLS